jgi:hypothetical protein
MRITYRCTECDKRFAVVGSLVGHVHNEHGVPFDQIDLKTVSIQDMKK